MVLAPLMLLHSVLGDTTAVPVIQELVLDGNTSRTIEGGDFIIMGELKLLENSSLHIINANVTFSENEEIKYTLSGNSRLTIINSSIKWESPRDIQATENASITLTNVDLYSKNQINNRIYYNGGIGLAGNTRDKGH